MKYLFLFFFILFQITGFAQPKNQPLAVAAATRNNIVYKGMPNPISIAVPGYYNKDIVVKTNVGKIEHYENTSNYTLNTGLCSEKSLIISVYIRKPNKKLQLVGVSEFKIREWPKPIVQLGSIESDGYISYERLNNADAVFILETCFTVCDLGHTIKEFHVKHKRKDGTINIFKSTNSLLTEEIKESFRNAEDGDVVMIYDVTVVGPNGTEKIDDELILDIKKI